MLRPHLTSDEYYHVCHRGNNKQDIFCDDNDRYRLLFLVLYSQALGSFDQMNRLVKEFRESVQHPMLDKNEKLLESQKRIGSNRVIELINFTFMPNHLHLTLFSKTDTGISLYMQKILNAYTKYFNIKHERSGHLFQGPYKLIHIEDDDQLLYLSTYIHKNPCELKGWSDMEKLKQYPWSSLQDYIVENRWDSLLAKQHVMDYFKSTLEYERYLTDSPAKSDELELDF